MSEINVYLVAITDKHEKLGVKDQVVKYLEDKGIISGFYDEELGWYAAGDSSGSVFSEPNSRGQAFQYAIIYDSQAAHFVPDSSSAGYGAKCINCGNSLEEVLYQLLDEQGDDSEPIDVGDKSLKCPICSTENELPFLSTEIDTAVTHFYVTFCDVDTIAISPTILKDLEAILRRPVKILAERL